MTDRRAELAELAPKPIGRKRSVTAPELHEIFATAALNSGNMAKTARELNEEREEKGLEPFTADTLRRWRREHREVYDKTALEMQERVRIQEAEHRMALAADEREIEARIAKRLNEKVDEIQTRDLPGALRNVTTAGAINIDKALALQGENRGGVTINVSVGENLRGLASRGQKFYDDEGNEISLDEALKRAGSIPSTATEVEDDDVVYVDKATPVDG